MEKNPKTKYANNTNQNPITKLQISKA